jgi:signal transduction histidine kinase
MLSTVMPALTIRPHLSRHTIRVRMALSYWGLFVTSGAVLLAVTVALWQGGTTAHVPARGAAHPGAATVTGSDLPQLLAVAGIALAMMAVVSLAVGWLVAGRFLRPVRAITAAVNRISATSLHERLNLTGPEDDLTELADTFDSLLERLERSFEFERRFAANASHELRTPLTTMRVWLDVATAKPGPLPPQLTALAGRLGHELDLLDTLVDSFLTLARTQQGPVTDQAIVSLDDLASTAIDRHAGAIGGRALRVERSRCPRARVSGSATLLSRMIGNVIDNAVRHNEPGGWIRVSTGADGPLARIDVANGGPVLSQDDVGALAQPFRRPGADRTGSGKGTGLGLSIVASIASVHGGSLGLSALPGGGLQVTIELPLAMATAAGAPA